MAIVVADHHLRDFDAWFELYKANPPPDIGSWSVARGVDDPNRVHVVGVMEDSEVGAVKDYMGSAQMQQAFAQVNEMSTKPLVFTWFEDVTPG